MPRRLAAFPLAALLLTSCGTEPPAPGHLILQVSETPTLTAATDVVISGTVTREPALQNVPLVVTIVTPTVTLTDTATAAGAFGGSVPLAPDSTTIITVTASDGTGSTCAPVTLEVVQDRTPPTVAEWSPANEADLASTDAQVHIRFAEPIRPGSATIWLRHHSQPVGGVVSLSPDSLTVTFAPTVPLAPNAVYQVSVSGATDRVGHRAEPSSACFVTSGSLWNTPDPASDYFVTVTPPAQGTVPTDLVELRLWWYAPIMMDSTTLRFLVRYTLPRSMDAVSPANTFAALDFDLDRDSTTGQKPVKDLVLGALLPSSGAGADYGILLLPRVSPADSSLTVIWTGPLEGNVIHTFLPDVCGPNIGFAVPRSAIGVPVGPMHLVVYTDVADPDGWGYADAAPDSGYYTVPLPYYVTHPAGSAGRDEGAARPIDDWILTRLRRLLRRH